MRKTFGISMMLVILAVTGLLLFAPPFEKRPPQVKLSPSGRYINAKTAFTITLNDKSTGLKDIQVVLKQNGRNWNLYTAIFPLGTYNTRIPLTINPRKLGLKEGPFTLSVSTTDRSLWRWGKGNTATAQTHMIVDRTPPNITLIFNTHRIRQYGTGVAVFNTSPDAVKAKVQIGKLTFKAYPIRSDKQALWTVLFGIPPYAGSQKARLITEDRAGNIRIVTLPFHLLAQKVKRETFHISNTFIQNKIYPLLPPEEKSLSPVQAFKKVNEELRREDEEKLFQLAAQSSNTKLWKGAFIRMKNSRVTATFGDQRTYVYKGKVISHSIHLGYDLASVAHAPVPAGNTGQVLFTGFMGICGNTVLIDHGLGLTSLYAHLKRITVRTGELVKKGKIIGYTDSTGLATGDHLHFSILLSGHPVDPSEWWNNKWLKETVTSAIISHLKEKGNVPTNRSG